MTRLATRGSALALAQAELALEALARRFPGRSFQLQVVDSEGDLRPTEEVPDLPGQGWFTSNLERELLLDRVEGAIHSAKDLPTQGSPELVTAAYLPRGDPRDAFVTGSRVPWRDLPPGARVGTSSPRRSHQLLALRPDLRFQGLRGNVETRLRRVEEGQLDACVLARAGLDRVGREEGSQPLDPLSESTPAPAQGAIALQARAGSELAGLLCALDDGETRACVEAERSVLRHLGGGCQLPLGVLAEPLPGGRARLTAAWAEDPTALRRLSRETDLDGLSDLAGELARSLA